MQSDCQKYVKLTFQIVVTIKQGNNRETLFFYIIEGPGLTLWLSDFLVVFLITVIYSK